ncbi:MAG TPA: alpha/beta hydrolase [Thermoleophilaceae bacterium]|nr:alpha/beta hydrolase [Thermoleophilaceae bacterium]
MHDADAFATRRLEVRGVEIEFVLEGEGGYPLVLLHGWPDTKRIWWRNIGPLAEAGFCVIAPDMRGNGGSCLAPDGAYDTAANARDLEALLRALGHERCGVVGGDWGGVVAYDLSLRFPDLVERLVVFNTVPPRLPGGSREVPPEVMQAADYFIRQGTDADGLCAELSTPELRRRYVAQMYGPRFWAAPGGFSPEDVEFMTEPFGDAERFRASLAPYEYALRKRAWSEAPLLDRPNPTPTLVLYGPEDHVIPRDFPARMAEALPDRMGPFVVPGAGHWVQWEAADLLNGAVRHFHLDLLRTSGA